MTGTLVNTVMNPWVLWKTTNLTCWATISFSRTRFMGIPN
jgi:hypothetical protein